MSDYKYALGQWVKFAANRNLCKVLGRAEYINAENTYYVEGEGNPGPIAGEWIKESDLAKAV